MTKYGSAQATPEDGITNVFHISNGEIKMTSVSLQDDGEYICSIAYILGSGLCNIPPSSIYVTVLG